MKRLTFAFSIFLFVMWASLAVAADSALLLREIEAEVPAFMSTWERIVNIDSGTGDAEGLAKVEAVIIQRLNELGAEVKIVPAKPAVGNCIVGTFKGTGKARIMMMIHYDTVSQKGEATRRPFRVEGNRAFGPGVGDAKSGVALILHTIKLLHELKFKAYGSLTVLFNPDEEESSTGSRNLIRETAAGQDYVLSCEPAPGDIVTVATNGIARLHLTVKGLAAHAGAAPEKGRNAAMELAHQLLQLNELGDPAKRTTVNWTVLRAGQKVNVIPDEASAVADMRLSQISELERVKRQAEKIVKQRLVPGTEVTVKVENRRPPMPRNRATDDMAETAKRIGVEIGHHIEAKEMPFGSDAGFAYNPAGDKPAVLESLGLLGKRFHSSEEYAEIDSIVPRLYLAVRMVQELSGVRQEGN